MLSFFSNTHQYFSCKPILKLIISCYRELGSNVPQHSYLICHSNVNSCGGHHPFPDCWKPNRPILVPCSTKLIGFLGFGRGRQGDFVINPLPQSPSCIKKKTYFKEFLVVTHSHHSPQAAPLSEVNDFRPRWNDYLERCLGWWICPFEYEAGYICDISYENCDSFCAETRYNGARVATVIIIAAARANVSDTVVVDESILERTNNQLRIKSPINPQDLTVFSVPLKRLKNRQIRITKRVFQQLIVLLKYTL
tara:strand:- start:293 stop:1045 length:753 start_codon:yes stop_codon:yes gene_type:complete